MCCRHNYTAHNIQDGSVTLVLLLCVLSVLRLHVTPAVSTRPPRWISDSCITVMYYYYYYYYYYYVSSQS